MNRRLRGLCKGRLSVLLAVYFVKREGERYDVTFSTVALHFVLHDKELLCKRKKLRATRVYF